MTDHQQVLKRPSRQEDEQDLLKLQQEFLSAKSVPSAKVKRIIKDRKLPERSDLCASKSSTNSVDVPETDDSPMIIDFTDHTTDLPVLLAITENFIRASDVCVAGFTNESFPKPFKLSDTPTSRTEEQNENSSTKRRSLFSQQIGKRQSLTKPQPGSHSRSKSTPDTSQFSCIVKEHTPVQSGNIHQEPPTAQMGDIHHENLAKMAIMSEEEILQYQMQLVEKLGSEMVNFIKSRKKDKKASTVVGTSEEIPGSSLDCKGFPTQPDPHYSGVTTAHSENLSELGLPIDPAETNDWLHMDKLELNKLSWMSQLPLPKPLDPKTGHTARFDFLGLLLAHEEDVSVQMGLHHHGEEPEVAGYTIEELFHLSRSSFPAQRIITLQTLAHILRNNHLGLFDECLQVRLFPQLLDAGLVYLLRCALDDPQVAVVSAALHTLHSLLVSRPDEVCLDRMFPWIEGHVNPLLTPKEKVTQSGTEEKIEEVPDSEIVTADVIQGLVRMDTLPRLRYILEVMKPDDETVVSHVLEILIRIARHSLQAASQVMDCPRLTRTIFTNFLPVHWIHTDANSGNPYGIPQPLALKLVRTLSTVGRHIAARLIQDTDLRSALNVYITCELGYSAISLVRFEALRTWKIFLSYGLAGDIWIDLYPVLLGHLQHFQALNLWNASRGDIQYVSLLYCALQGLLPISAARQSDERKKTLFWHHVEGLYDLSCCLFQKWIQEMISSGIANILESQSALTAVLNFISTFYEFEMKQPEGNVAVVCERLNKLLNQSVYPFLNSKEFFNVTSFVKNSSLLSAVGASSEKRDAASLPSLGATAWGGRRMSLSEDTTAPFCVAFLKFLNIADKLHCLSNHAAFSVFECFVDFMTDIVALPPSQKSWFTKQDVFLLHQLLHLFSFKDRRSEGIDMSLCHQMALLLPSMTLPGESYLLEQLFSSVIFHPTYFNEDLSISVQFLVVQDLKSPLMSASGQPLQVRESQVLSEALQHLPEIKSLYLRHLLQGLSQHKLSRCRMMQEFEQVPSVSFTCSLESPFFSPEWILIPITSVFDLIRKSDANVSSEVDVSSVRLCLLWLYYLMVSKPLYIKSLSAGNLFVSIASIFLLSDDLFLEPTIQGTLQWVLQRFLILHPADRMGLDQIRKPVAFLTFYQELLQQFEGSSYGDPLFGATVLVPLQQHYPSFFRRLVLTEHTSALRMLGMPLQQMLVPLENYLHPLENDLLLLKSYLQLLQSGTLSRCPILFTMAVHHLHHYIFTEEKPHAKTLLETVWRHRKKDSVAAVLLYKHVDKTTGIVVCSNLSSDRIKMLKDLGIKDPQM